MKSTPALTHDRKDRFETDALSSHFLRRSSMNWKKSALFSAVLALMLLASAELATRVVFSRLSWAGRFLDYDETSNRIRWVLINREQGSRDQLTAADVNHDGEHIHRYHPVRGWMTKAHLESDPAAHRPGITTNSLGFRGSAEIPATKQRYRILLIGDSFTFGDEVGDSETFGAYLQQLLPSVEIVNAGVPGYGHDQMLLLLNDEGKKLQPDLVILGYTNTDIERNGKNFKFSAKPRAEFTKGVLHWDNIPVPTPLALLSAEKWHLKLWDLARIAYARKNAQRDNDADHALTILLLQEIDRSIHALGAKSLFLYIPHPAEPIFPERLHWDEWSADVCARAGIPYYSAEDDLRAEVKSGVDIHPMGRGHFNPAGNHALATSLARYLGAHQYLPPGATVAALP